MTDRMVQRLASLYSRRIVNVNVNILLAGILALVPTMLVVKLLYLGLGIADPTHLSHGQKLLITGVTFVTDVVCDVAIYYGLHWVANHSARLRRVRNEAIDAASQVPFLKDATSVQMQRAIISPVLYVIWLGTQYMLLAVIEPWWAMMIGWVLGITVARTLHTIWMIRAQRWARGQLERIHVLPPPDDPPASDPSEPPPSDPSEPGPQ